MPAPSAPCVAALHSVMMGEVAAASAPTRLRTILGSCIGVALFDRRAKVGGIAHVVLPDSRGSTENPGKYADTAIPLLIQRIRAVNGGPAGKLIAKIAGGANMFGGLNAAKIGELNAAAVHSILRDLGICVLAEDVGGDKGRRMSLDLETGEVLIEVQGNPPQTM